MRFKGSSKYSLTPSNEKEVRVGRAERVNGGRRRLPGEEEIDSNPSCNISRPVKMDTQATIVSDEMYPD